MSLIKCKECRKEISDQAAACPNCGAPLQLAVAAETTQSKGSNPVAVVGIVGVIIVVLGLFYVYPFVFMGTDDSGAISLGQSPLAPAPVVTRAEYNRIQEGTTYVQVREVIGAAGEELSRSDLAGFTTVMYSWTNSNGSNMNAMFQNDALINKAQFGLR